MGSSIYRVYIPDELIAELDKIRNRIKVKIGGRPSRHKTVSPSRSAYITEAIRRENERLLNEEEEDFPRACWWCVDLAEDGQCGSTKSRWQGHEAPGRTGCDDWTPF